MHGAQDQNLPKFVLLQSETGYKDFKRCFKSCVQDFQQKFLTDQEQKCSDNCMKKYEQARAFASAILDNHLNKMVLQDRNLQMAFQNNTGHV